MISWTIPLFAVLWNEKHFITLDYNISYFFREEEAKENNNYSCSKLSLTYFVYIDVGHRHPFSYSYILSLSRHFDLPWEILNNDRNGNLKFESWHKSYKTKLLLLSKNSISLSTSKHFLWLLKGTIKIKGTWKC